MGENGKTVTKHEHCCMKYANRKPNYQMARSDIHSDIMKSMRGTGTETV